MRMRLAALSLALACCLPALPARAKDTPTTRQLLAASKPSEWRTPNPDDLVYMQLPQGRVVIELTPAFSPLHVANIRTLIREHYFDGLAIVRVQDNFVAQWDDPNGDDGGDKAKIRPLGKARATLPPEFTRPIEATQGYPRLAWTPLPDGDVYAPQVGFSEGFPVGRDPASGREWPVQCYGTVGVGRDVAPDSGNGSALYAIIGQAPRRLDHNLAVVGRVLQGMPYLSSLPRGNGPMGFYTKASRRTPIISMRLAADLPPSQREKIQVLRTSSPTFAALIDAARHGHNAFYPTPVGKVGICDISAPVKVDGKPLP